MVNLGKYTRQPMDGMGRDYLVPFEMFGHIQICEKFQLLGLKFKPLGDESHGRKATKTWIPVSQANW